jgi:hypothetical protein
MAGDLHSEIAKLLHGAPDFRTRGAELFGDALAADDDSGIVAQQANDAAEARVGGAVARGASWVGAGDKTIMREGSGS